VQYASLVGAFDRVLATFDFLHRRDNILIVQKTFACLAISLLVGPIWAAGDHNNKSQYLALGDSLAFGFNPLVQPPNLSEYIGYPKIVGFFLDRALVNASCPGETSSTFIGTSTVFYPGFNCTQMVEQNQLFVNYDGAQNQLDYAVTFLTGNPNTKLVTIDIGVNDIGILQYNCTEQFSGNPQAITTCEENGLPATLSTIGQNLTTIFSALRGTGYQNPIVAVDSFAFDYSDPVQTGALTAFDTLTEQVGSQFGVTIADIYPVFEHVAARYGGDTCAAGLLIKLTSSTCDTHPNLIGQALISATVLLALAK
jgi:lysophospholipase L1-like esterase